MSTTDDEAPSAELSRNEVRVQNPTLADRMRVVSTDSFLWLTRQDQFVVGALCLLAFGLLSVHWSRLQLADPPPVRIDRPDDHIAYQIDINTANWVELTQLNGVGPKLAQRIVDERRTNGAFRSVDDLTRVKHIGDALVERNRPWLRVGTEDQADPEVDDSHPNAASDAGRD